MRHDQYAHASCIVSGRNISGTLKLNQSSASGKPLARRAALYDPRYFRKSGDMLPSAPRNTGTPLFTDIPAPVRTNNPPFAALTAVSSCAASAAAVSRRDAEDDATSGAPSALLSLPPLPPLLSPTCLLRGSALWSMVKGRCW